MRCRTCSFFSYAFGIVLLLLSFEGRAAMSFASEVVASSVVERGVSSNILGANDGEWVELGGTPSFVVVSFGRVFMDGPGDEISVFLSNWDFFEAFSIFASADNVAYSLVESFDPQTFPGHDPSNAPPFTTVTADLSNSGLSSASFVRLEATNPPPNFPEYDAVGVVPLPAPVLLLLTSCALMGFFVRRGAGRGMGE